MSLNTYIETNVLNESNLSELHGSGVGDILIKMNNNNNNNNLFFQSGTTNNIDNGLCISSTNNIGFGTTDIKEKIDISGAIITDNYKLPSKSIPIIDISSNIKTSGYMNISKGLSINDNKFIVDISGNTKMFGNLDISNNLNLNNVFGISSNGNFTTKGKLDISGNLNVNNNFTVSNTGDVLIKGLLDVTNKTTFHSDVSLNGGVLDIGNNHTLYIDSSNNRVGIGGLPDTSYNFHVKGNTKIKGDLVINGTTSIQDTSSNTVTSFNLTNNGTGPAIIVNQLGTQPIAKFTDDNNPVLFIANNGLTGVGKVDPSYNLDIMGTAFVKQDLNINNGLSLSIPKQSVSSGVNDNYLSYDFTDYPDTELKKQVIIQNTTLNTSDTISTISQSLNSDLIAWYQFNDTSSNMLLDSSPNGLHLTAYNTPVFSNTDYKRGNGSIQFTGNNYVKLPSYNFNTGSNITISFWYKMEGTNQTESIFRFYNGTNRTIEIDKSHSSWFYRYLRFMVGGSAIWIDTIDDNMWHHFVWVIMANGGTSLIYKNNVLIASQNLPAIPNLLSDNNIISYNGFKGKIDDFRIYNKQLTTNNIAYLYYDISYNNLYNATINNNISIDTTTNYLYTDTSNILFWYKFDNSTTDMLLDSSPNNLHLTSYNNPTFITSNYKKGNGTISFVKNNNLSPYLTIPSLNFSTIQSLSICFWMKYTTTNYINIITLQTSSNENILIGKYNGSLIFRMGNQTGLGVDPNVWFHITWVIKTINGCTLWEIYKNGKLEMSLFQKATIPTILLNNNNIGKNGSDTTYFEGELDDFRLYNKALTSDEVKSIVGMKYTLTRTQGYKTPFSYFWNGSVTDNNDNAYIKLPQATITPLISSQKFSISFWKNHVNLNNEYPLLQLRYNNLMSYIDIIGSTNSDTTTSQLTIYNTKAVQKYPPVSLFATEALIVAKQCTISGQTYGNGIYKVDYSSFGNYTWNYPSALFRGRYSWGSWGSYTFTGFYGQVNPYNSAYYSISNTTSTISPGYKGDWVKLEFPHGFKLSYIKIYNREDYLIYYAPKNYRIYGSNDNINWTLLIDTNDASYVATNGQYQPQYVHTSASILNTNNNSFKIYAMVVNQIYTYNSVNGSIVTDELEFYGYEADLTYNTSWNNVNVANTWQHCVYTIEYTTPNLLVDMYVNGQKKTATSGGIFNISSFPLLSPTTESYGLIGSNNTTVDLTPTYIEDFKMYDRILYENEIKNLYDPNIYPLNNNNPNPIIFNSVVTNNLDISQGIVVNDKLKIDASGNLDTSGNVTVAGTVTVYGNISQSGVFNQDGDIDVSGNAILKGNLDISQNLRVNADKFMIDPSSGNIISKGTMDISGYFNVNNKFKIDSIGNITSTGTLDTSKNFSINQNNLIVDSSGNVKSKGQIDVSNNFVVNTNKFVVDNSGNVQIPGTLDISNNLTVNTNKLTINSTTGTIQSASSVDISKNFTINTNKFVVDSSGNVTSAGTLDISNNIAINNNKFIVDSSGNIKSAGNFDISDNFSLNTNSVLIDKSGNILAKGALSGVQQFSVNDNKFNIDASGNAKSKGNFDLSQNMSVGTNIFKTNIDKKYIGLNTDNSNNNNIFDISGNIATSTGFFGDISNSIIISHRDYANTTDYLIKQTTSGELTINSKSLTETIDICFDNTPQCVINSDGDMTINGTIYTYSDIRIKENIQVIEHALDKVKALQGIKYNLINEDETYKKKHIGLLAQDVEKVMPEAIELDGDIKTVAYGNLIGLLIQSIKELYDKYKTMQNK
jgi:hypothetical protein